MTAFWRGLSGVFRAALNSIGLWLCDHSLEHGDYVNGRLVMTCMKCGRVEVAGFVKGRGSRDNW